jgi:hypothetical protein
VRRLVVLLGAVGAAALSSFDPGFAATVPVSSKTLTAPKACILTANPATSVVATDSFVQQASAGTNSGTATTMNVTSSNLGNRRVYLRFDLTKCAPVIPATASVLDASLRLWVSAIPTACRTHDLFRVTATWTETGITWTNQPFGTTVNNPAQSARTSSANVGTAPCTYSAASQYVAWSVTTDLAAFVNGSQTNFGWMIRDDVENSVTSRASTYTTKNSGTLANSPQLIVTYRS